MLSFGLSILHELSISRDWELQIPKPRAPLPPPPAKLVLAHCCPNWGGAHHPNTEPSFSVTHHSVPPCAALSGPRQAHPRWTGTSLQLPDLILPETTCLEVQAQTGNASVQLWEPM